MGAIIEFTRYPEGSVRQALSGYSIEDLTAIALRVRVREPENRKKKELIELTAARITDREAAREYWINMYDEERKLFEQVIYRGEKELLPNEYDACAYLAGAGYLYITKDQKLTVPKEIGDLYIGLETGPFRRERERYALLRTYIKAAAALYGRIPADRLAELFNSQNEEKTDRSELIVTYRRMAKRSGTVDYQEYCFQDHYRRPDTLPEAFPEQYYLPAKEIFLQYAHPGYIEETPAYAEWNRFLEEAGIDRREIQLINDQLYGMIGAGEGLEELNQALDEYEIVFPTGKQRMKARELLAKLIRSTRKAANGGYTDQEMELLTDAGRKE